MKVGAIDISAASAYIRKLGVGVFRDSALQWQLKRTEPTLLPALLAQPKVVVLSEYLVKCV